jgi:hypothetical protein
LCEGNADIPKPISLEVTYYYYFRGVAAQNIGRSVFGMHHENYPSTDATDKKEDAHMSDSPPAD